MNVTAVSKETTMNGPRGQTETPDTQAFSHALKQQMTPSKKANDGEGDDGSAEHALDGEQSSEDKEESHAFIIVPPFLRFETHSELSKPALTKASIEGSPVEGSSPMAPKGTLSAMAADVKDAVGLMETAPVETMDEGLQSLPSVDGASPDAGIEASKETANTPAGKETANAPASKETANANMPDKTTDSKGLSKQQGAAVEQSTKADTPAKQGNEIAGRMTDTPITSKKEPSDIPVDKADKSVQTTTTHAPQADRTDKVIINADNRVAHIASEELADVPVIHATDSDQTDGVVVDRVNVTQPQQATPQVNRLSQAEPAQTIRHVTLNDAPEIIQDLMTTTSSNASGDTVYQSRLTLTPETLGQITVELTYTDEGLSGQLVFDTDEAKQWVESQWQQLKNPLKLNGIKLNTFDFHVAKQPDAMPTENFNFSQQSDQSKREQQEKRKHTAHGSDHSDTEGLTNDVVLRHGHGVSYYA